MRPEIPGLPSSEVAMGRFIPSDGRVENVSPSTNATAKHCADKIGNCRNLRRCRNKPRITCPLLIDETLRALFGNSGLSEATGLTEVG